MSTRTADERMRRKRSTSEELRKRGRQLFHARVRMQESLLALVLKEMPKRFVDVIAEVVGNAFQLGYEAGWDESRDATGD